MVKLLLIVLQLVFVQVRSSSAGYASYLYGTNSPPVKEYTGTENLFMDATGPRVVVFYSPLCVSSLFAAYCTGTVSFWWLLRFGESHSLIHSSMHFFFLFVASLHRLQA
jgi:hypothetical protein